MVAMCCACGAWAQDEPAALTNNTEAMQRLFLDEQARFAGDTNMLVLPGLRADRARREIVIQAEATGIGENDTAEFFIIAPHSGNGYEALSRSLASAGDIDRGLRFIGMTPGRGIDYDRQQFWPKGERVNVWFRIPGRPAAPVRAESLVLDVRAGRPLPSSGLVYVQPPAEWAAQSASPGEHPVDADTRGSVAANYNEICTLLDVPRAAPQSEVYAKQTVNTGLLFHAGQPLEIVMEPELPAGRARVLDLELTVTGSPVASQTLADLRFAFRADDNAVAAASGMDLNALLRSLVTLCQEGRDPFVALRIDGRVQIEALKALCLVLASIETDRGIRMEPPAAGNLYYKAYMPDDELRDRETRIMQPAELTLTYAADGTTALSLLEIGEYWHDDESKPTLTFTTHPIESPDALRAQVAQADATLPILLIFAPPTLSHGELMRWLGPCLATHPTVHVFTPVEDP
jgi:hypothetical protein